MVSPIVLAGLECAPSAFFHVIDDVRPERYTDRVDADRFNLVEMVSHIADLEDVFQDRLRTALEHPGSSVESFDPAARAEEKHYGTRDVHHELEVFRNRRNDTVDLLKNLQPGDAAKTFVHPKYGEMSIRELASAIAAHDLYHLEQASRYLR